MTRSLFRHIPARVETADQAARRKAQFGALRARAISHIPLGLPRTPAGFGRDYSKADGVLHATRPRNMRRFDRLVERLCSVA